MKRALPAVAAMAVATALAIAGCTSGSSSSAASTGAVSAGSASAVSWHSCTEQGASMLCGSLQVPLDYSHPNGRKITLALSQVPATAPAAKRQGVLLVNPGGPGGAGLSLAAFVAEGLDPSVAADYTIVGFDTRGVGTSVPSLSCDSSFFSRARPDYIPASAAEEQQNVDRAKTYAADCEKKYGWLLPYMTTENIARDMNSIRMALGQKQISYFGYSYGTYIGQVFATLFPHQLRRMVLDSTVDPRGAWWQDNIEQDYAFQGRLEVFFAWMAKYDSVYHLGTTAAEVSASWYKARDQLEAHPIPVNGTPLIGPDEFDDTMLIGGYDNSYWPGLAAALSSYLNDHSTSQLVSQYDQEGIQNENEFAVYNAVECSDVSWPRNWATWNTDTKQVYATAPFEAWDNAWFNAACAFWPVKGPSKPLQIKGAGLPGILMLQGTLDPATPYSGAQVAHSLLPSARMVVVEGGGNHGQSLSDPPNNCVNGYLNRYLATGALPQHPGKVNATCPALPDPTPSSAG
ncbi:MAG: alpha/beta hydrolase [Streptosporangiaceae bacterium]